MKRRQELNELQAGQVVVELDHWLKTCFRLPLALHPWHIRLFKLCRVTSLSIDPSLEADNFELLVDSSLQQQIEQLLDALPIQPTRHRRPTPSAELQSFQALELQQEALSLLQQCFDAARTQQPLPWTELQRLSQRILLTTQKAPQALLLVCQLRQPEDYLLQHSFSVTVLMALMLPELDIPSLDQPDWLLGSLLMGIGKSQLPSSLLNKTGPLTAAERSQIESQIDCALQLLNPYPLPDLSRRLIAEHHERRDGSGYPQGLSAEQLSLAGELAGLIDVYDALISDRSYQSSLPASRILGELLNQQRFRPELVAQLIRVLGVYPVGSLVVLQSGRVALVLAQGKDWQRPKVRIIYSLTHQHYLAPKDLDLAQFDDPILRYQDPKSLNLQVQAFI